MSATHSSLNIKNNSLAQGW